jgi:CheY-like chemotaxis protein
MVTENTMRILLADNDADNRVLFNEALNEIDHKISVVIATSGPDVLLCMGNQRPDIVFLEIDLPKKNGLECLLHIRTMMKMDTSIVMYSDTRNELDFKNAFRLGANYFLTKPSCPKYLVETIKYIIAPSTSRFNHEWKNFVITRHSIVP